MEYDNNRDHRAISLALNMNIDYQSSDKTRQDNHESRHAPLCHVACHHTNHLHTTPGGMSCRTVPAGRQVYKYVYVYKIFQGDKDD